MKRVSFRVTNKINEEMLRIARSKNLSLNRLLYDWITSVGIQQLESMGPTQLELFNHAELEARPTFSSVDQI